ncbi:MAG: N-acetyltransferase [Aliidiomarina sp.]|uniref:N-acetyltransferase n=1 Tax=Aliidiomarina sp. TaxID=1872439 RepID=UPI0025BCF759|nr:N-acetyltransferase [Aliidiomarina sp.]MCH8502656.1 N-acetyltransferase [Aliidiomarina sp.]
MIREYSPADISQVLEVWLTASIKAHSFIAPDFWESKINDMRDVYIPASETFIFESKKKVVGFFCLYGDILAAIFVTPELQGSGIGTALLNDAKNRRKSLQLTVYKENIRSIGFYEKHGFTCVGEQKDEHTSHSEIIMEFHS